MNDGRRAELSNMDRRTYLIATVGGLGLVALLATGYLFVASMRPSEKALNDSMVAVTLPSLEPGIVYSVDVGGYVLFVLKPNKDQIAAIHFLDSHTSNASTNAYKTDLGVYVYWAYSSRWSWRCPLEHYPPQESSLLQWNKNAKWLGGYWDPQCEVSFDYAGRSVQRDEYTYNGFTWKPEGMKTPSIFEKTGDRYIVSILPR